MADVSGTHAAVERQGSAVFPFRGRLASGRAREQGKDFPEGLLAGNGLWKRLVRHGLVAVAAVILVLADVADRCQVGHDAVGASLGDAQAARDVMQSHPRVVREKQQHTTVVTHEAPAPMPETLSRFLEKNCEHCVVDLKIQGSSDAARRPGQRDQTTVLTRPDLLIALMRTTRLSAKADSQTVRWASHPKRLPALVERPSPQPLVHLTRTGLA